MEVVVAYLRHLPTMTSEGSGKLRQTKKRKPCSEKWLRHSVSHMTSAYTRLITLQKLVTKIGLYDTVISEKMSQHESVVTYWQHIASFYTQSASKEMNSNHFTKRDMLRPSSGMDITTRKNIPQILVRRSITPATKIANILFTAGWLHIKFVADVEAIQQDFLRISYVVPCQTSFNQLSIIIC
jgi:hypothetical protein